MTISLYSVIFRLFTTLSDISIPRFFIAFVGLIICFLSVLTLLDAISNIKKTYEIEQAVDSKIKELLTINKALGAYKSDTKDSPELVIRDAQSYLDAMNVFLCMIDSYLNIVYVNKRFAAVLGYNDVDIVGKNVIDVFPLQNKDEFRSLLQNWFLGKETFLDHYEMPLLSSEGQELIIEWSNTALYDDSNTLISLLCSGVNVTIKKQTEKELRLSSEFQRFLTQTSIILVSESIETIEETINYVLHYCAEFFHVDRGYIFEFSSDKKTMTNTYEWCRDGVAPQKDRIQDFSIYSLPWWRDQFFSSDYVYIPDIDLLPSAAQPEKKEFTAQGIKSLLTMPLIINGDRIGFFGFDSVNECKPWGENQISLLRILGESLSSAIQKKRMKEILQITESKYKLIAEHTADNIWTMDLDLNLTYVSPSIYQITGYTSEEAMKRSLSESLTSESFLNIQKIIKEEFDIEKTKKGDPNRSRTIESSQYKKDGSIVYVEDKISFLRNENLEPIGILGVTRDITARKEAEKLIQSKYELELVISFISSQLIGDIHFDDAIYQSLSDIGSLCNASRAYLFKINENELTMTNTHEWCKEGVSPQIENLQNLPLSAFPWWMKKLYNGDTIDVADVSKMPPDAKNEKEILQQQDIQSVLILPIFTKNILYGFMGFDNTHSSFTWSDENIYLLKLFSGIISSFIERKLFEQKLYELNYCFIQLTSDPYENINRMVSLLGSLLNPVCVLYNIIQNNFLCTQSTWNAPSDLPLVDASESHICYDVITQKKDEVFLVRNLDKTKYAQRDPNVSKYNLKTYIGYPVKVQGKYVGSLCAVYQRDFVPSNEDNYFIAILATAISVEEERKIAQEKMKESITELEKLDQIKKDFLSMVTHEYRTPLTVVQGYIQLFKEDSTIVEKYSKHLNAILSSMDRLHEITNKLIQVSRIEREKMTLSKTKVNLSELVNEIVLMYKSMWKEKYNCVVSIEENITADLDPLLIQSVVLNLLSNAQKYTKGGGTIKVSLKKKDKIVVCKVSDTGIGISEDDQKRIFEPFFLAQSGLTRQCERLGIGLYVSRSIIELHGGKMFFKSKEGEGSTFYFRLPL